MSGVGSEQSRPQDEPLVTGEYGSFTGNCKWFNNKIGYGFVTVMDGEHKGKDIFVHHTGVCPKNSNFKTLTKGEYVSLNVTNGKNGLQAVDLTGILGGPLMCDNVIVQHHQRQFYNNHQTFNNSEGENTNASSSST